MRVNIAHFERIGWINLLSIAFACDNGQSFDPVCCGYLVSRQTDFVCCLNSGFGSSSLSKKGIVFFDNQTSKLQYLHETI